MCESVLFPISILFILYSLLLFPFPTYYHSLNRHTTDSVTTVWRPPNLHSRTPGYTHQFHNSTALHCALYPPGFVQYDWILGLVGSIHFLRPSTPATPDAEQVHHLPPCSIPELTRSCCSYLWSFASQPTYPQLCCAERESHLLCCMSLCIAIHPSLLF